MDKVLKKSVIFFLVVSLILFLIYVLSPVINPCISSCIKRFPANMGRPHIGVYWNVAKSDTANYALNAAIFSAMLAIANIFIDFEDWVRQR